MSFFFFSSRRRHTRLQGDWSSDVCSSDLGQPNELHVREVLREGRGDPRGLVGAGVVGDHDPPGERQLGLEVLVKPSNRARDRKSTRLNSSHLVISYAVFCLKKKKIVHDVF